MDSYIVGFKGLSATNARIESLRADFSGLENLDHIISDVLERLTLSQRVQDNVAWVRVGTVSRQDFDGWFSEIVRKQLGKVLGQLRNKAIKAAREAGAGSAQTAVLRRMYKDEYKVNINISGNRRRLSSRDRIVEEPTGGKSGIRRNRTVSSRTTRTRKYYGPDRSFILRFLNEGTDVRTALPGGPTGRGSRATYGNRGNITAKGFFHSMRSDMEDAARELGTTLVGYVEDWLKQAYKESE